MEQSPVEGKFGVIGNAVAYPMAQALAKAVRRATEDKCIREVEELKDVQRYG
jgi:hypothetical protein